MLLARFGALATLAALAALTLLARPACAQRTDGENNMYKPCVRKDKRVGYCVEDNMCFENLTIATGTTFIGDTEARIDEPHIPDCGEYLWCCILESETVAPRPEATPAPGPGVMPAPGPGVTPAPGPGVTPAPGPGVTPMPGPGVTPAPGPGITPMPEFKKSNCSLFYGECPWCVGLYRIGGDVAQGHRMESGLYCAGALVAPSVVLTSGTCVRTVSGENVWARVPNAADPAHHYAVTKKVIHPNYNSGTHENDFGLFLLKEEVRWEGGPMTACVGRGGVLSRNCVVVGFDTNEELITTAVSVTDGDCPGRRRPRNIPDLACGVSADAACHAKPGGAILCHSPADGQGGMEIVGVARRNCVAGNVLLGKLQLHMDWLQEQLRRLGFPLLQYDA